MDNVKNITLSIFVPCLNEEKNITNALNNIKESVQNINYEILVADDASKDKTIEMIEKFKNNNPNLDIKIFRNESHKGLGFNYFATAHKATGQYYLNLSGDACEPPATIKKFINNNNISSLWDVGCNTGEYTISAFEVGVKNIVGLDLDGYSLNLSYRSLTKKILNMYCNP